MLANKYRASLGAREFVEGVAMTRHAAGVGQRVAAQRL
jgi:hypothetical protein